MPIDEYLKRNRPEIMANIMVPDFSIHLSVIKREQRGQLIAGKSFDDFLNTVAVSETIGMEVELED